MSWTTSAIIKKHLFDLDRQPTEYRDVEVRLNSAGVGYTPHRGLVSGSEKVKRPVSMTPTEQSGVTLNGETWVQLSYDNLVPRQLIVAADNGLSTVYQLDKDYAFNPDGGKVRRIDGGDITDGASVEILYQRYEVLTRDSDYTIDYDTGGLTAKTGGSLEPETAIWVDYRTSAASGADQLIDEAIAEAEDKILGNLKDDYDASSTDQGIKTGATELTLAVICRGLASRSLSDGLSSAENRSHGWRELARQYELAAWRTLRPFLKSPQIVQGLKKSNQSWEWS